MKRKGRNRFSVFDLSVKKVLLSIVGIMFFVGGLCLIIEHVLADVYTVGAVDLDDDMAEEQDDLNGVLLDEDVEIYTSEYTGEDSWLVPTGALPSYFNSRDTYTDVRVKDQNTEGLCWGYSITTTIEYYLASHYNDDTTEISPKALDYRMVDAQQAYKNNNFPNAYYDRWLTSGGASRNIGKAATYSMLTMAFSDPFGAVSENKFLSVIKNNDSRLGEINRYEGIWNLDNKDDILDDGKYYTVKQDFKSLNNSDNIDYVVSGMKMMNYPYYNTGENREALIKEIKNAIVENGAAWTSVEWNLSRCAYKEEKDSKINYTVIDRGVEACKRTDDSGNLYRVGHALAVVGWDDNWEYYDGNVLKEGAFILQNSWGTKYDTEYAYYLGYNSMIHAAYIDSVDSYSSSAHYYALPEYKPQTISPASDELIFELRTEGKEKIKGFTFSEAIGAHDYDVYISENGRSDGFRKIGSLSSRLGITNYTFDENLVFDGDYAIKLKKKDSTAIENSEKYRSILRVYSDDVWTLSLNANGGSGGMGTVSCSVAQGSCSVVVPYDLPTRQNYYLLGYADTASATVASYHPGDSVPIGANKTIYAVWAPVYTLSFDLNGGEGSVASMECHPDITNGSCSLVIPEYNITRNDYHFLGWAEDNDVTTSIYQPGSGVLLDYDTILYAVWEPVTKYALSYNLNGASGSIDDSICALELNASSCDVQVSNIIPSLDDQYFLGWGEDSTGGIVDYQPGDTETLSADKTLYAVWADGSVEWQSNSNYVVNSGKNAVIRINYPVEHFVKLLIDNIEVSNMGEDKYKIESGSTILTIYSTHLDTLDLGEHRLQAVYDNGAERETTFTVAENRPDDPDDPLNPVDPNDSSNPVSPDGLSGDEIDDLPVPNTAGGSDGSAPATGFITKGEDGNVGIWPYVLPMVMVVVVGGLYIKRRGGKHRRFD